MPDGQIFTANHLKTGRSPAKTLKTTSALKDIVARTSDTADHTAVSQVFDELERKAQATGDKDFLQALHHYQATREGRNSCPLYNHSRTSA
jgi:hypothetical protein